MVNVEWPDFLSQHDLVYERAGATWRDGLPIGNGAVGVLAYAPFHPEFVINKNDVYDYRGVERRCLHHADVVKCLNERGTAADVERLEREAEQRCRDAAEEEPSAATTPKTCGILRIGFGRDNTWTGAHLISQRLSIHDACLHTDLDKHMSHPRMESFVPRKKNVLAVRVRDVSWVASFDNRVELIRPDDAELPAPKMTADGDRLILEQTLSGGLRYVMVAKVALTGGTAWRDWIEKYYRPQYYPHLPDVVTSCVKGKRAIASTGGDFDVFVAVATSLETADPLAAATNLAEEAVATGFEALHAEHRRWWAAFWRKSFLKLDQSFLEQLWYISLYQLASCYGEAPVAGLCGLWYGPDEAPSQHLPWCGYYTNDQNSQMPPMPLFAANHLELAEGFYETFNRMIPELKARTREVYGTEGIAFPVTCAPLRCDVSDYNHCGGPYHGLIYTWGYLYTKDRDLLETRLYPFLSNVCKFFADYMTFDETTGRYRLWPSKAPELEDFIGAANPTHTLSLLKICMRQAAEAAETLGVDQDWAIRWRDILDKYPEYALDHGIILEAEGIRANQYTNQYGGTYPVYPCGEYGADSPTELHTVIRRTFESFDARFAMRSYADTQGRNHFHYGWSWFFSGMVAMRMGWKAEAWEVFHNEALRCYLKPNGLFTHNSFLVADSAATEANLDHVPDALIMDQDEIMPLKEPMHGNITSEATPNWEARETVFPALEMSSAYMTFINETLLQSHGGLIRVFPSVSAAFTGGFDRFRTEGAFLVSAWKDAGETRGVAVESTAGGELCLLNPWPGKTVRCRMPNGDRASCSGNCFRLSTEPGDTFRFFLCEDVQRQAEEKTFAAEKIAAPHGLQLADGTIVWLGKPDFKSRAMQHAAFANQGSVLSNIVPRPD